MRGAIVGIVTRWRDLEHIYSIFLYFRLLATSYPNFESLEYRERTLALGYLPKKSEVTNEVMNGFSELSFDINLSVDFSAFLLYIAIMFNINKGEDKNLK